MIQWIVDLAGRNSDLEDLSILLTASADLRVEKDDGDRFRLRSQALDAAATYDEASVTASAQLAKADQAAALLFEQHRPVQIHEILGIREDGSRWFGRTLSVSTPPTVSLSAEVERSITAEAPSQALLTIEYDRSALLLPDNQLVIAALSPSFGILERLLADGYRLDALHWREFEELIAELLNKDGYDVTIGPGRSDGGGDILATKDLGESGVFSAVWQAKKQHVGSKVGVSIVRELADTRNEMRASKGIVVTTTHLTRGALERVRRDQGLLAKVDRDDLMAWMARLARGGRK